MAERKDSPLLRVGDLKDAGGLIVRLRDAQDPLSLYLREQLSEEIQRQLHEHSSSYPPSDKLQRALVEELNRILKLEGIYNEERFAPVTLTEDTQRLIQQNPQGEDIIRLNRLLLEEAYPHEIARSQRNSVIVTFYSYKGGVGRSMALANVAWLLANKYHKSVLAVDWDLEAPGLHRFFDLKPEDLKPGLIDLVHDYKDLLRQENASVSSKLVDIKKYISSVKSINDNIDGSISLLAAGQQDETYASRVNEFSWEEFYEKWHGFGFIEYLKEELKNEAEIVLVDSRTGVTDIGGICTLQLPDIVVTLFALNEQNLAGVEFIAESILEKSTEVGKRKRPPILLLRPSRVEITGGQDKKLEWEGKAAKRLGKYLPDSDRREPLRFMKKKGIPYISDYSYGEMPLAVRRDPLGALAESFDDLTSSILKATSLWDEEESNQRIYRDAHSSISNTNTSTEIRKQPIWSDLIASGVTQFKKFLQRIRELYEFLNRFS